MLTRDYEAETKDRVEFIRGALAASGAAGIVYANSGGKDCTLVGILCKKACGNTLGLIMPCASKRNYGEDKDDAEAIAAQFGIETRIVDLTGARDALAKSVSAAVSLSPGTTAPAGLSPGALANIAPRLRMAALYAVSLNESRLVAGTGNRSEGYMGYFTKWGDGAYDFNPIADLTVTEVYEFLRHLGVSGPVVEKAPSAGLYDGQTDEGDMGVAYASIDRFLLTGETCARDMAVIERYHAASEHKRNPPLIYGS